MRVGFLDDLTVHLEHEAQHAVGRGMLRTEVQREIANLSHADSFTRPDRHVLSACS